MKNVKTILTMVSDKLKPLFMEEKKTNPTNQTDEKENTSSVKIKTSSIIAAVFNGLGIGLLLGLLLGLAVSPVVSGVIGTISSLLAVFLGLNDKYMGQIKSIRIGAFGFFAVVGILSGMFIRTHNALSPTKDEIKKEFLNAGFNENQALYFTALQVAEYVPEGWFETTAADTVANSKRSRSTQSHLFSSHVDVSQCAVLKSADRDFPKSEMVYSFESAGGVWKELAYGLSPDFPDQVFVDALLAMRDGFCGLGQAGTIEIKSTEKLQNLTNTNSLNEIKSALQQAGESWQVILEKTESTIPEDYKKQLYLQLIKILADEKSN
ncbi:MAG: hypothetical protein R2750_06415 [Bacteroidales bacterium]